jgi:hypothetical protein
MFYDTSSILVVNPTPMGSVLSDTCTFCSYEDGTVDICYHGTDIRFYSAHQHFDYFTGMFSGLTICFCYRTYDQRPDSPPIELVLRKLTFHTLPVTIWFQPRNKEGIKSHNFKDLLQLKNAYNIRYPDDHEEHNGEVHFKC